MNTPIVSSLKSSYFVLGWILFIVGIASGLIGMVLVLMLHYLQHLAFGYSPEQIISSESFLEGVTAAARSRRFLILVSCGFLAGCGWWLLEKLGSPLVSIARAIKEDKMMPLLTTIVHGILQIATIALGSPLGREVAPRELSALFSQKIASRLHLTVGETRLMLACGAGAGLAAVYNVPLAGALFVAEVLLQEFSWAVLIPAFATSALAVFVSWWGLGNAPTYTFHTAEITPALIIWSAIVGPLLGGLAFGFIRFANAQRLRAAQGRAIIFFCLVNFGLLGFAAIYFPALLGNGKSIVQIEFNESVLIHTSAILLFLRTLFVWGSLRAGAWGGLLTPSLANGALLGVLLGGLWNVIWPHTDLEAFALVAATAFLAAAQKMPLVAVIMLFEMTRANFIFLIPIMFAVVGAMSVSWWLQNKSSSSS
ncbi:MAG: chloride channel protein [Legionella sp. 40-6]|nr:MAG: chloride channel protein [Legionella sp. 40-6]